MLVSASDVADTIRLLVPGFVALSVFYWFGLTVKRTDWRWTVWSVVASIPIAWGADWLSDLLAIKHAAVSSAAADCAAKGITAQSSTSQISSTVADCVKSAIAADSSQLHLLIAIAIAIVGGFAAVWVWKQLGERYPTLLRRTALDAWRAYLAESHWIQLKTDDLVFSGWNKSVADPVETDDLDIFLADPAIVHDDGTVRVLDKVEGMIVRREDIKWIQVMKPEPS